MRFAVKSKRMRSAQAPVQSGAWMKPSGTERGRRITSRLAECSSREWGDRHRDPKSQRSPIEASVRRSSQSRRPSRPGVEVAWKVVSQPHRVGDVSPAYQSELASIFSNRLPSPEQDAHEVELGCRIEANILVGGEGGNQGNPRSGAVSPKSPPKNFKIRIFAKTPVLK